MPAIRSLAPPRLAVGLLLWLCLLAPVFGEQDLERGLKVAYLYNFTHFISWPDARLGDAFHLCVLGDPELATALKVIQQSEKRAQGRPIQVLALNEMPVEPAACQIFFIGEQAIDRVAQARDRFRGEPVVLVADSAGLARRGIAINFFLKPDVLGEGKRLRFEINPSALAGRGLQVDAQLYEVAEIVR